jgi:hypothetical protein
MKYGLILLMGLLVGSARGMDEIDLNEVSPSSDQDTQEIFVGALEKKLGLSICNGPALFKFLKDNKASDPDYKAFIRDIGARTQSDQPEDLSPLCQKLIEFQGQYAAMLKQQMQQDAMHNEALNRIALRKAQYRLCAEVTVGLFGLISLIMNIVQATNHMCSKKLAN